VRIVRKIEGQEVDSLWRKTTVTKPTPRMPPTAPKDYPGFLISSHGEKKVADCSASDLVLYEEWIHNRIHSGELLETPYSNAAWLRFYENWLLSEDAVDKTNQPLSTHDSMIAALHSCESSSIESVQITEDFYSNWLSNSDLLTPQLVY
jgi:hypothetical protein